MKVTVLLRNDHEGLAALFDQFNKPGAARGQNGKRELFDEIRRELLIHSQMEQEVFYPALRETSSVRAAELVSAAEHEHQAVEKLLQELGAKESDKNFEPRMEQLMDEVRQHMQ